MKVDSVKSPSFQALPVSEIKIKGIDSKYKLFECSPKDSEFLGDLVTKVKLAKLMPDMSAWDIFAWNNTFKHSVIFNYDEAKILLEACDGVPCGILNYRFTDGPLHLMYAVTMPDRVNHRVPAAGQILFNEVFSRFLKSDVPNIELTAMRRTPFNPEEKYRKFGFFPVCDDAYSVYMRAWREEIAKTFEKQKEFIQVKYIENPEEVDLGKVLSIQA